ncbi:hypothetical protein BDR04DRAFT_1102023 [Suillus decipiens]|nr:hypothetical protein BDR04DRAFT_1102023 [Suillus decipiens]
MQDIKAGRCPTVFPHPQRYHSRSPSEDLSPRTEMRFSILAAVVALTASMYVSACLPTGHPCNLENPSVCCGTICGSTDGRHYTCE